MEILLNNKKYTIKNTCTVSHLLRRIGQKKEVAVFVNGRALKYSEYDTTYLSEQDEVRIFRPLGGG